MTQERIDLAAVRARLAGLRGADYWRSLEELAGTEAFEEWLHREFPQGASEWHDGASRRQFLKIMGASMALAGATACTRQPPEKIVPYVKQPEQLVPGKPLFFATAMPLAGRATGLLVESHMGRPTKVEGNPQHPASLGATDVFAQASILTLYDPDRSETITYLNDIRPWGEFLQAARTAVDALSARKGAGLHFLTETVSSPTLAAELHALQKELPGMRWHQYEAVNRDNSRAGAIQAFGEPAEVHYRFEAARVVLSLESDFLASGPGSLRYARAFASGRKVADGSAEMNRLYVVESMLTPTGATADHRLPLKSSAIAAFAAAVAAEIGVKAEGDTGASRSALGEEARAWVGPVARDLAAHKGSSVVVAGESQPAFVHALTLAMNEALGNIGKTVIVTEPVDANPVDQIESLRELTAAIDAGTVDTLVILGGNPVYTAPADLRFAERLTRVRLRMHLGLYRDETAALCQWHVPEAHYLESWGDERAFDGTATIIQPLIAPLFAGRTAAEIVAAFSSRPGRTSYDMVREHWAAWLGGFTPADSRFEAFWRRALHDGTIPGTAAKPKQAAVKALRGGPPPAPAGQDALEIAFRPDPTIYDGRFANNAWLQELPKPVTTLTWDAVALVSPRDAERLGLSSGDVVTLRLKGRSARMPAWVAPGQARGSITVHLGYGRERAGQVGNSVGFNAYLLRASQAPWFEGGLQVERTGESYPLANRQTHQLMEGRHLVRSGTLEEYRKHPEFAREMTHEARSSLHPQWSYEGHKWGMSIDLNACTGCNACVVACVAENNIPVVGKEGVIRGREMHWLRVDTYFKGEMDSPETHFQPVPCMHCENAPCEVVCPVAATVHSPEGLNDMIYNRCVGTRYCSNNCPYKVRRFNFLLYNDWNERTLKMARNPDVTVRSRGVMEKCTYCVQRINYAKSEAARENRPIADGEILTACQAACPAEAIVFGDLNDKGSRVAKMQSEPRDYSLLGELNTRPRTRYLADLRNPNPEMPDARGAKGEAARPAHPSEPTR
ncbi:MAG: TAT-variant-translocated molybdopterin oxidoreductase [Vicinamibacterales bacterium]